LAPSPTALNQAVAVGAWGAAVVLLRAQTRVAALAQGTPTVLFALAIVAFASLASPTLTRLPWGLALSATGAVGAAGLVLLASPPALRKAGVEYTAVNVALVFVGLVSVFIAWSQVFVPSAVGTEWIAHSATPGRAVGNLRQPNHLATLLLWAALASIPLASSSAMRPQTAIKWCGAVAFCLPLFGIVLSGSRTGLLGVAWLVAWGLFDRALPRLARALLIVSPLICLAGNALLSWWGSLNNLGALGMSTRAGEVDVSNARFSIWSNALSLIADQPWLGVGFGNFNFAWTLTPFPDRNPQFFDHAHNLPLHLAVELGVPLALLVVGLLFWGLWQAFVRSRGVPGPEGIARRACFVMVLMMGWHSMLEYPLWYAYFLLPTAFMWGLCLSRPDAGAGGDAAQGRPVPWIAAGGAAMVIAAAVAIWDYQRVVAIFAPREDNRATLLERIVEGRHSWFFAHHADYALVTSIDGAGMVPGAFDRATHFLLDTRLMIAWSTSLAARGDVDRARHIAARLREFRNPGAAEFFAPCDDAAVVDKPFQCSPPERLYGWRDFLDVK
jgi:O-antigen ligase